MPGTVVFLGAGATKSCGGPLTSEILPNILQRKPLADPAAPDPAGRVNLIESFLSALFHVTPASPREHYPALPLLMSMIDIALDRRQPLHQEWLLPHISEAARAGPGPCTAPLEVSAAAPALASRYDAISDRVEHLRVSWP